MLNSTVTPTPPITIPPGAGDLVMLGGFGSTWKLEGNQTDERCSIVHHPLLPRALAAPLHRHHREDEYSYVISGKLGALLGDDVVEAGPGSWVFKPRNQWHTFWNAGDTPCEIIEVISPAGFEQFFRELTAVWPDLSRMPPLLEKYALDMDPDSVPGLCQRFGLNMGEPEMAA